MSYATIQVSEPLYSANRFPKTKITVDQGGTSSGKTYTVMQVAGDICAIEHNRIFTVVGQDIPNLKKGALRDFQTIVANSAWLKSQILKYNASDRAYYFRSGSILEFNSYTDEQDAKSGKRDYLFVNEANGIPYMVYWQLAIRTKRNIWLDYNPTAKFWVHDHLMGNNNVTLLVSDHRHNRFLPKEMHDEIESIGDTELWKVYARGLTGKIHGLIYPNWQPVEEIPLHLNTVCGLDFGFNHKMALIEVAKESNRLFWNELIYQSELTISDLIQLMKMLNLGRKPIYCDHSEPDKIHDLKLAGFNALMADKDVTNGIDFVKRNNLYITKRSAGLKKEANSYKWKVDKNDVTLDEPVKFLDDACFTAETPIITSTGNKAIAAIECGDKVLTSKGFKEVLHKFNNGWKEICDYKIVTSRATIQLKCTPAHLVKTISGWKSISELQAGETVYLALTSTAKHIEDIKTANTLPITTPVCTEMFGNTSMVRYRMDSRYTIKTKIPITTTPSIYNYSQLKYTNNTISRKGWLVIPNGLKTFRQKDRMQQSNGTKAKMAGYGTNNMHRRIPTLYMRKPSLNAAYNVAPRLKSLLSPNQKTSFAAINAKASGAEIKDWIISKSNVSTVATPLVAINTINQYFALPVVVESITGIPSGKEQVFDLCVSEIHEYYANGLLVHNCDAGRYGSYTHFHGGTTPMRVADPHNTQPTKPTNQQLLNSLK